MGLIARVLEFIRSDRNGDKFADVKSNPGGDANVTAEHFADPGDDSQPLTNDLLTVVSIPRTGGAVAVGYIDPANAGIASPGEKRIYSRDSSGTVVAQIHLKNDGEIQVSNDNGSAVLSPAGGFLFTTPNSTFNINDDGSIKGDNGSGAFELESGGDYVVNNVTITPDGKITTPDVIEADDVTATNQNVTLSTHTHDSGAVGSPDPGS